MINRLKHMVAGTILGGAIPIIFLVVFIIIITWLAGFKLGISSPEFMAFISQLLEGKLPYAISYFGISGAVVGAVVGLSLSVDEN